MLAGSLKQVHTVRAAVTPLTHYAHEYCGSRHGTYMPNVFKQLKTWTPSTILVVYFCRACAARCACHRISGLWCRFLFSRWRLCLRMARSPVGLQRISSLLGNACRGRHDFAYSLCDFVPTGCPVQGFMWIVMGTTWLSCSARAGASGPRTATHGVCSTASVIFTTTWITSAVPIFEDELALSRMNHVMATATAASGADVLP